jgi:hypothetical protein
MEEHPAACKEDSDILSVEDHSELESFNLGFDLNDSDLDFLPSLPVSVGLQVEVLGVGADVLFHGHDMLDINDVCNAIDLHGPRARRVKLSYRMSQAKQLADALQRCCSQLEHVEMSA